jgi:hypothetical protein
MEFFVERKGRGRKMDEEKRGAKYGMCCRRYIHIIVDKYEKKETSEFFL